MNKTICILGLGINMIASITLATTCSRCGADGNVCSHCGRCDTCGHTNSCPMFSPWNN